MMMSPKAAAIALLLASVVNSPVYADDDGGAKPLLEGELETGLSTDWNFSSDDPTAEIVDLYAEAALAVKFNAANWVAFNLGLTLEPVLDPLASTDRYFGDHGLYVDTLNIQVEHAGFMAVAGKFGPGFGTAWDVTPGIYGTDFAEDYELSEMIGFGAASMPSMRVRRGSSRLAATCSTRTTRSSPIRPSLGGGETRPRQAARAIPEG
jgi:hypothetical protein